MATRPKSQTPSSQSELTKLSSELQLLQAERANRLKARNDLLTYASLVDIPGRPINPSDSRATGSIDNDIDADSTRYEPIKASFAKHHKLWIECLQAVADGKIPRLMGLMPPGSAKSLYSSVLFPTHILGRFKGSSAIVASYGTELPRKFGRRARSIVRQPRYRRIFNTGLSSDSSAADEWTLENGSEWMAAGILTGITGNRFDFIIWDDLIKGREQADSDLIRNKTWDAYIDDLQTRRKPNTAEIGVTTRWHEDDVAGRILPKDYEGQSGWVTGQDGNKWFVVCLPAECERQDDILGRKPGEYLWPEWFTPEYFAPFKRQARTWNALYQQRPAPESGDYFQADWLLPFEQMPLGLPKGIRREQLSIYGASDYATTADGGDYTVHVIVGIDQDHRLYLLDMWRKQSASDKWVEAFCDLVQKWKPIGWAEEAGQIKAGVGPFLKKRLMERQLYIARKQFPTRGDKAVRAQAIRGRMAQCGLYVPTNAPWFPALKAELMVFPNGRNDDQADALGLIGQILDLMVPMSPDGYELEKVKILSSDPMQCTVTLDDLFEDNERRQRGKVLRIH